MSVWVAGCAGDEDEAPEVEGAHDIECIVDAEVDLLDGVAALDKEDGDITPDMRISVTPSVNVTDGYASFPAEGSYRVTYTSRDSAGNVTSESVIVDAVERELYYDFTQAGGFRCYAGDNVTVSRCGMYGGVYQIKASGAEVEEDVLLARDFTLTPGRKHTFRYSYYSSADARTTLYADGKPVAKAQIFRGENTLELSYVPYGETTGAEISLSLGGIADDENGGSLEFILFGAEFVHPLNVSGEQLPDFSFAGKTISRFDGTEGNSFASADGSYAQLEVTGAASSEADMWRGGMFINTGMQTVNGVSYTVSFDVKSTQAAPVSVNLQNKQWDETLYGNIWEEDVTTGKRVSCTFKPDTASAGTLWLYVMSGAYVNNVAISNLSVTAVSEGDATEEIEMADFSLVRPEGSASALYTDKSGFKLVADFFPAVDNQLQVSSPVFHVSGSGENYVISFKAKATRPVSVVFAGPKAGGWDPTWLWQRVTITEEEQTFTVTYLSAEGGNRDNQLVWQFGSSVNQAYTDVVIEVSDIKISLKDANLD